MSFRHRTVLSLALVLSLVTARLCVAPTSPSTAPLMGVSERGLFDIEVLTSPDPIPLNQPFELEVRLGARGDGVIRIGWPVTELVGRTLRVEGWMPGHGHGMLRQAQVDELGDGRYRVRGMLFHMPGAWDLRVMVIETRIEGDYRIVEDDQVVFEVVL